jgi:tetratricopeptide (TPR) repeat protein
VVEQMIRILMHIPGEHKAVIQSYKNLAILYEELDNVTISTHFHQRCLEIAQSMGDLEEEGSANEQLGLAFQRTGDITKAIKYFEFFGHLAKKVDNKEDQSKASKHLMNAYRIYAEQCEEREDYKESVVYLKKCLEQAQACGDIVAEGSAHYKIGNTYQLIGSQEQRIHHLSAYLDICRKTGDETGEGVALSTLAVATKDNTEVSIKYLKENIELAQRTKQTLSLANACKDLAIIYNSTGQYEEAVKFFEQYFTLAKEIGDSKLIDTARVFLGLAKGNAQVSSMLKKTDENNLFNGSRAVNL